MTITRLQSGYQALTATTSNDYEFPSTTGTNTLLIAAVMVNGTITGGMSGWTLIGSYSTNPTTYLYYKVNTTPSTVSVSASWSSSRNSILFVAEYLGVALVTPVDVSDFLSSFSYTSPVITTTANAELLIATFGRMEPGAFTLVTSGYSIVNQVNTANIGGCFIDNIELNSTGSQSCTVSVSTNENAITKTLTAIKNASGGGGGGGSPTIRRTSFIQSRRGKATK